jgi:hypothetical protein
MNGRMMIGCAVVWMIWKLRNLIVFENSRGSTAEVVEGVESGFLEVVGSPD